MTVGGEQPRQATEPHSSRPDLRRVKLGQNPDTHGVKSLPAISSQLSATKKPNVPMDLIHTSQRETAVLRY
jgi:hypothetical protein